MKLRALAAATLSIAFSLPTAATRAQDVLRTKSGDELRGSIVDRGIDAVEFSSSELGRVRVPWTSIRALRPKGEPESVFDPDWQAPPDAERPDGYLRWEVGADDAADRLLTGTSRWLHTPTGTVVLLVGVAHIGDAAYYERLQARLDTCDRVLFESVGRGDATEDELARLDVLLRMQLLMRDALGLRFQKEAMNYARSFWTRADVDLDDLRRSLESRDAGLPTDHPLLGGLLSRIATIAEGGKGQRSPVLRARAARLLGPALAQADQIMRQPGLAGLKGALIEDRNEAALAALRAELEIGVSAGRRIAIFYGAAHLPDLDERLAARPEFTWQGLEWDTAWVVPKDSALPRPNRRAIDQLLDGANARFDGRLEFSVWLGGAVGPSWFERGADRVMAAASSIKTSYLIELFARYADRLDEPLDGVAEIVGDAEHPAVTHFDPEMRAEIVREMRGVSCRRVAQMMIHGIGVSNEVYNAAANVTTALLGGPGPLTEKLQGRFGSGAWVRRYMLAARDVTGDNEVTARFLSAPLQAIARGRLRGLAPATVVAVRDQLFLRENPMRGRLYSKTGALDTDPMTRIESGFWETPDGQVIVYAVMVQLPDPGAEPRATVAERMATTARDLADGIVRAALR